MPTYEFECEDDDIQVEVVLDIDAEKVLYCDLCKKKMRRIYGPIGVQFNATGFYKTDNGG